MKNQLEYYLLAQCAAQIAEKKGLFDTGAALRDVAKRIMRDEHGRASLTLQVARSGSSTNIVHMAEFLH